MQPPAGTIESINLRNFLCHKKLTVTLNPQINFIVGSNGSGKSAILTAITVCLGTRANFTQRGNSTKSLIREGEQTAQVTLSIRNCGDSAYKSDVFPDLIIIERTLSHIISLNGYRIKNIHGKIISTKKEDVVLISEHFNFQIDNPLVILSQETSKRFLSSSSSSEKYEFFLKGTQLEQLSIDYRYTKEKLAAIQQALQQAKQNLPTLESEVNSIRQKIDTIQNMQNLYEKKDFLKHELCWAMVNEAKRELNEKQTSLMHIQKKHALMQERQSNLQDEIHRLVESIEEANSLVQNRIAQSKNFHAEKHRLDNHFSQIEMSILQSQAVRDRIQNTINSYEQEFNLLSSNSISNVSSAGFETQIDQLERQLVDTTSQISTDRQQLETQAATIRQLEEVSGHAKSKLSSTLTEIQSLKSKISTIQKSSNDSSILYGDRMPDLLQLIRQNSSKFNILPIGPIGLEISLKDTKWSIAVEAVISRMLDCFIVTSKEDRALLQSYLDSFGLRNSIFTVPASSPKNIHLPTSSNNFITVLDVLNIRNSFVTNLLIKISHVNKVILVKDRQEGYRLLSQLQSSQAECAFTAEGQKILANSGNSSRSVFSYNTGHGKGKLGSSPQEQLKYLQSKLSEKESNSIQIRQDLLQFENDLRNQHSQSDALTQRISRNEELSFQLTRSLRSLKSSLEESQFSPSKLSDPKQEIQQKINLTEKQLASANNHHDQLMQERETLQQRIDELNEKKQESDCQLDESKRLIIQLVEEKTKLSQQVEKYSSSLQSSQSQIDALQSSYDAAKQEFQHREMAAGQVSGEIQTERLSSEVEQELIQVEAVIETREQDVGDPEILVDLYSSKSQSLSFLKNSILSNEQISNSLQSAIDYRMQRWLHFRNGIANRANVHFIWNLMNRGFSGSLEFDHNAEKLTPTICPTSVASGNVASLSGGEKSFSTVSLLLALWENVHCPVRCLDEFDVFMDSVNRRQVIQMMIDFALQNSTQYIFISPLGFSTLGIKEDPPWLKVVKLKEPERNQAVLEF